MLTAQEIKTAVSRYWSGRAAGFDLAPSHNVLTEAQHQAWLDLCRGAQSDVVSISAQVDQSTGELNLHADHAIMMA